MSGNSELPFARAALWRATSGRRPSCLDFDPGTPREFNVLDVMKLRSWNCNFQPWKTSRSEFFCRVGTFWAKKPHTVDQNLPNGKVWRKSWHDFYKLSGSSGIGGSTASSASARDLRCSHLGQTRQVFTSAKQKISRFINCHDCIMIAWYAAWYAMGKYGEGVNKLKHLGRLCEAAGWAANSKWGHHRAKPSITSRPWNETLDLHGWDVWCWDNFYIYSFFCVFIFGGWRDCCEIHFVSLLSLCFNRVSCGCKAGDVEDNSGRVDCSDRLSFLLGARFVFQPETFDCWQVTSTCKILEIFLIFFAAATRCVLKIGWD